MTDFTFPAGINPEVDSLAWIDNTTIFTSPLSGTTRTESKPGGKWALTFVVGGLMNVSQSANPTHVIEAFLYRLNGAEHRAVIHDFGYQRSGPGGGTPLVNGASQTGLSLITDGWSINTTVLYAGDRIGISGQMIPIVADAATNGSGQVTLTLAHPIRTAPANNAVIEISNPTARYVLLNKASFAARPGVVKTVLAEFEEAIP